MLRCLRSSARDFRASSAGASPGLTVSAEGGQTSPAESPASRLIRNLAYLTTGQIATWVLSALWAFIVPRKIGAAGMGVMVVAWSVTGILSNIEALGTSNFLITEIARRPQRARNLIADAIALRLLLAVPVWVLLALYLKLSHPSTVQLVVLLLAAASMQLQLIGQTILAGFQGLEKMQYYVYADVISRICGAGGSVVLVLFGFGVEALMALAVLGAASMLAMSIAWAHRHLGFALPSKLGDIKTVAVGSLAFWANSVFISIYAWIDSVVLAILTNATVVGWYGAPLKLYATLMFVPVIVTTAVLPRLSSAHEKGLESFRAVLLPTAELIVLVSFPVAAGTIAVSRPLVSLIYGPDFANSVIILTLLAVSLPPLYLNIVVGQALTASKRQLEWTKVMAVAAVLNPIINVFAIRYFAANFGNGAIGATLSLFATELFTVAAGTYLMRDVIRALRLGRLFKALLASIFMGVAVFLAGRYGLVLQIGLGVVIFAMLAILLKLFNADEIAILSQLIAPIRKALRLDKPAPERPQNLGDRLAASPPRRVLVMMTCVGPGEALGVLPLIYAINRKFPAADVDLVFDGYAGDVATASRHGFRRTIQCHIYTAQARTSVGLRLKKLIAAGRLAIMVGGRYDLVLILPWGSRLLNLIAQIAGRTQVGFVDHSPAFINQPLGPSPTGVAVNHIEQTRSVLSAIGIDASAQVPQRLDLPIDIAAARAQLTRHGVSDRRQVALLHVGSDWACQQWLPERWTCLADRLAARGFQIVFSGLAREAGLIQEVRAGMREPSVSLAGLTSLRQLSALVSLADLCVSVDVVTSDLALACHVPSVVLAGPTVPLMPHGTLQRITANRASSQLRVAMNACRDGKREQRGCLDYSCPMSGLRDISVDDVLMCVEQSLAHTAPTVEAVRAR